MTTSERRNKMGIEKIKLTEEEVEYLKSTVRAMRASKVGFQEACMFCKATEQCLWGKLKKMYPKEADKDASFDHEEYILMYIKKEEDSE